MIRAMLRNLRTGVVTQRAPVTPPARFRGAPRVCPGIRFETLHIEIIFGMSLQQ